MFRKLTIFLFSALLCGCGNGPAADDPVAEEPLTADLQQMQGVWTALNTNHFCRCEVSIDGPTIRLRYQLTPESPRLNRNVSIRNVDEARKMLVMYNDLGGWPYALTSSNGVELLELKFFDEINHNWAEVTLARKTTEP